MELFLRSIHIDSMAFLLLNRLVTLVGAVVLGRGMSETASESCMAHLCLLHDEHLLLSIKDECEYLFEKTEECNFDDFIDDRDLKYIVVLALIKIGEYVNSLSKELRNG